MPPRPRHPAHQIDPVQLLTHLTENLENGTVFERQSGVLSLFHYSSNCQYETRWNQWNLLARGLILDRREQKIVATPFPKFFNYGEQGFHLPAEPFEAFEKMDGSLGICFFHGGRWNITTKGAFGQTQALWAEQWLRQRNLAALVPGTTYLFEIIYRQNQIVVRYGFEGLVLLGGYDHQGYELESDELAATAVELGCRLATRFSFPDVAGVLQAAAHLDRTAEGFVIRFANGYRLKIKGEVYRRAHRVMTRVTPLGIWDALEARDDLDALRREIPEEFWSDFDDLRRCLTGRLTRLLAEVESHFDRLAGVTDKEIGQSLAELPELARVFLFPRRRFGKDWMEHEKTRQAIFRRLRPKGNFLEDYQPSKQLRQALENDS